MENKIYLYLKIIPIVFIFITTFCVSYIQVDKTKFEVEKNIQNEIETIYQKEKEYLEQNVHIILDYIRHQKKQTLSIAQTRIKDKAIFALNIANNIYNTQKDMYPEESVKKNILNALRDIKYKSQSTNTDTYYFVQEYHDENTIIARLLPTTPQFENINRADLQDAYGKYHVKEFHNACLNGVGDFVTYHWKKIKDDKNAYPKLSYIAFFAPYNWMIGYGDYLDEIETDIKNETLSWISDIQDDKSYDFYVAELLDINGGKSFAKLLFNPKNLVENHDGFMDDDYKDLNGKEYRKLYLSDLRKDKKSLIDYNIINPNTNTPMDKLLYMELDSDWNWIIYQGVFLDEVYKKIENLNNQKDKKIQSIIFNGLIIAIIAALIMSVILYLISEKLKILLNGYKKREMENSVLLAQQSKMIALGEMIGNIAHQWRQPLSVISTIASGTKVKMDFEVIQKEEIEENLQNIVEQTQFLSETIDSFRNFITISQEKELLYFSKILDKSISLMEPILKDSNIKIIKEFKANGKVLGFENELIQSFFNVLNNAKEQLVEKIEDLDNRYILIKLEKENEQFKISIIDNAGGLKKENITKIFEPYFTTKHKSLGKGLGLTLSYKIITEHHNGKLEVKNESFEYEEKKFYGASFIFTFDVENLV